MQVSAATRRLERQDFVHVRPSISTRRADQTINLWSVRATFGNTKAGCQQIDGAIGQIVGVLLQQRWQ